MFSKCRKFDDCHYRNVFNICHFVILLEERFLVGKMTIFVTQVGEHCADWYECDEHWPILAALLS
jgi:hypothetical protein